MWTVETLNTTVDAEIEALPNDQRARLVRVAALIEAVGLDQLPHDTVRHLEGKLWEIRLKARTGISRAIYITATGRRIVILRVFMKKSQKTPYKELELSRVRAREVK